MGLYKLCHSIIFEEKILLNMDFSRTIPYNKFGLGGVAMNEFEKNVQTKRNDVVDSGIGFVVSFVFFAAIFTIATVIDFITK